MYAYTNRDGTKSLLFEDWLARMESEFDSVSKKILRAVRSSNRRKGRNQIVAELSDQELESARKYFLFQYVRTEVKRRDAIEDAKKNIDDLLQNAISLRRKEDKTITAEAIDEEVRILKKEIDKPYYYKNQWLSGIAKMLEGDGYKHMLSKGLVVGVIRSSLQEAFVIGDDPIIQAFPNGSTLRDQVAEIIMPIASDVALSIATTTNLKKVKRCWLYDQKVWEYNHDIFKRSDAIASGSVALTKRISML